MDAKGAITCSVPVHGFPALHFDMTTKPKALLWLTLSMAALLLPLIFWRSVKNHAKREHSAMVASQINLASNHMVEFEKDTNIDHLEEALRVVERVVVEGPDGIAQPEARREQARIWLSLIAMIDRNID